MMPGGSPFHWVLIVMLHANVAVLPPDPGICAIATSEGFQVPMVDERACLAARAGTLARIQDHHWDGAADCYPNGAR